MADIKIWQMVLGMVGTNCYLLQNAETKEMIIVDPADSAQRIISAITGQEGHPAAILLTHGHFDHIMAAAELRKEYNIPVYIHELDEEVLEDPRANLSGSWAASFSMKADHLVKEGDELDLAGFRIKVMHTPGHTKGSCCYYLPDEGILLSGDTLFCRSYGRVDFPTSSSQDMVNSVRRLLEELPGETHVLPGHESDTTIESEKRYNPLA